MSLRKQISSIVLSHIANRYCNNVQYAHSILSVMQILLGNSYKDYDFPKDIVFKSSPAITEDNFQRALSKVNEKEARRKKEGVYYTDCDVTDFVVANTLYHYVKSDSSKIFGYSTAIKNLKSLSIFEFNKILQAEIFDPTCGAGEFLLSALRIKLSIVSGSGSATAYDIIKSLYGNDIESLSTEITKLRLFFLLIDSWGELSDLNRIASTLCKNFTQKDAVVYDGRSFKEKDIIVGNPPYVEYGKFEGTPQFSYGNIYADVLHHSVSILKKDGIMAFVVPLSYTSTIRMSSLRKYIQSKTNKQLIMSFADRPDCLFTCVHQKLNIVMAQKNALRKGVFTSSYNYWYQSERGKLFENIKLTETKNESDAYCPKIGNQVERGIYNKFLNRRGEDILSLHSKCSSPSLYINQRGCFWMKAFTVNPVSNSYAKYNIPSEFVSFAYCLVNSSLFFLLWIIISDGWHITNKELSFVKFPRIIENSEIWDSLSTNLERKLEETKVFVGTKQVDYEYKHKYCKKEIDLIDDQLAVIFKLSSTQLQYIKNFALKYRIGDGE